MSSSRRPAGSRRSIHRTASQRKRPRRSSGRSIRSNSLPEADRSRSARPDSSSRSSFGSSDGSHLIPNGVEVCAPEPPTPTAYKDPPRLLFVGKLERVKGPDLFLAALEILDSEGWRFDVGIAGAGSLEAELRIAAGRLKRQKVTFCGSVGHDAVRSLYQAADIVVVPSRYEAFGIVVLEAMAAGRPLVATSVGGIPEIVNAPRNAILVAPEATSIAAGIRRLASDPDLGRRMAVANREDVAPFSWSRIAPRYLELFRELLPATRADD